MIRSVNLNASSESQRVFILHNFKDSETLEQIKDRIQEDIIGKAKLRYFMKELKFVLFFLKIITCFD